MSDHKQLQQGRKPFFEAPETAFQNWVALDREERLARGQILSALVKSGRADEYENHIAARLASQVPE